MERYNDQQIAWTVTLLREHGCIVTGDASANTPYRIDGVPCSVEYLMTAARLITSERPKSGSPGRRAVP
jgi:hypothetical protein